MLVDQGWTPGELPEVNKVWLFRWRQRFGICRRMTTVRFKISGVDCLRCLEVMFANIFRLRTLWRLCFGGSVPMRWVSFDQKPSWFNNAGLCLVR